MQLKPTLTYLYHFIPVMALLPLLASASLLRPENTDTLFQQQTQQQLEAKAPDVSLFAPIAKSRLKFPDETPCFKIEQVLVTGQEALPHWVPVQRLANQAVGHCMEEKGLTI